MRSIRETNHNAKRGGSIRRSSFHISLRYCMGVRTTTLDWTSLSETSVAFSTSGDFSIVGTGNWMVMRDVGCDQRRKGSAAGK